LLYRLPLLQTSFCGNGLVDEVGDEDHFTSIALLHYLVKCLCIQTSWCGDGVVDEDAGEECDDENSDDHDDCTGRLATGACVYLVINVQNISLYIC